MKEKEIKEAIDLAKKARQTLLWEVANTSTAIAESRHNAFVVERAVASMKNRMMDVQSIIADAIYILEAALAEKGGSR